MPLKLKSGLSLRSKVLLLAVVNAVLVVAALVWFTQTQLTQPLGDLLLGEARGRLTDVALHVGADLPLTNLNDQTALLERYSAAHGVQFYLFNSDGTEVVGPPISAPPPIVEYLRLSAEKTPLAALEGMSRPDAPALQSIQMDKLLGVVRERPFFARGAPGYWVVFRMPLRQLGQHGFQPGMLMMVSPSFFGTPFFFDSKPWVAIIGVILAIAAVCWLPLVRGVTSSIGKMKTATSQIAKGKFTSTRVDVQRADELGELSESLNRMALQLEGYVHGQKHFLRDAAHELRSPLARMQAAMGNIMEGEVPPDQEMFLEALREEIELMASLTTELLTFAREENQQGKLTLAPLRLVDVVARVVATENADGLANLRVEVDPKLTVMAHSDSLFRGLSNVIRNAIRYAGDAGPIELKAEPRGLETVITLTDKGPGIPEESLEMIFVPFYRLDISRARNDSNGLGMSIARSCIETCDGTIYCRNGNPGLVVTITLRAVPS